MPCWPGACWPHHDAYDPVHGELTEALRNAGLSACASGEQVHVVAAILVVPSGLVADVTFNEVDPPRDDVRECLRDKCMNVRVRPFRGSERMARLSF